MTLVLLSRLSRVIALGLLARCSSHNALLEQDSWSAAVGSTAGFESDRQACLGQSSVIESNARVGAIGGSGFYRGGAAASFGSDYDWDVFAACMEARGWRRQDRS